MAYFLKRTKQYNRTYLAIYESFYSADKKGTAHKCIKSLGSLEALQSKGIDDPVAYYQKEIEAMNQTRVLTNKPQISHRSPIQHMGYFPLKAILVKLNLQKEIEASDYRIIKKALINNDLSPIHLQSCTKHAERIVEIFKQQLKLVYQIDLTPRYCYFLHHKHVEAYIYLNSDGFPIELCFKAKKNTNIINVTKRNQPTLIEDYHNGNDYIFLDDISPYLDQIKKYNDQPIVICEENEQTKITEKKIITFDFQKEQLIESINLSLQTMYPGYQIIVTSALNLTNKEIIEIFHNYEDIQNILEDKQELPLELYKGQLLINYLILVLKNILMHKILNDRYSLLEINRFIEEFAVIKTENKYINLITMSPLVRDLSALTNVSLTNYYLNEYNLKKLMNWKI